MPGNAYNARLCGIYGKYDMTLAIFDLDNTLLNGDSDHAWGEFLIGKGLVDPVAHKAGNDHFYQLYQQGNLDILAYVDFAISPVKGMPRAEREALQQEFMSSSVEAMMLPKAQALLQQHRDNGDYCLIITATNHFVTAPIAERLGVDDLIATDLELVDDNYTGGVQGIPSFQAGKVRRLQDWLQAYNEGRPAGQQLSMENSVFYSDSFNDLPLLERAGKAVAVDPDPVLREQAIKRGWEIISLR